MITANIVIGCDDFYYLECLDGFNEFIRGPFDCKHDAVEYAREFRYKLNGRARSERANT